MMLEENAVLSEYFDMLDKLEFDETPPVNSSVCVQDIKTNKNQPYVLMALRFGPVLLPDLDPECGPLHEQRRLLEFWRDAWSRNEHPAYPGNNVTAEHIGFEHTNAHARSEYELTRSNEKVGKKLHANNIASLDFNKTSSIKSKFTNSLWSGEPVRSPMAHFLEDAAFLEWALAQGLRVYAFTYGGSNKELMYVYSSVCLSADKAKWQMRFEVAWQSQSQSHYCIFALNSGGEPALWTKDTAPAILHGTGNLERRIGGLKSAANAGDEIVWRSRYPDDNKSDLYYQSTVFKKWAGRAMLDGGLDTLPYLLYKFWIEGNAKVFIKHTDPKVGVWLFDLPSQDALGPMGTPLTPADIFSFFLKANERDLPNILSCANKNGYPSFMVQGCVHFEYEYRFWVSRGKVLTGTPVRRHDTALADLKWNAEPKNRSYRWTSLGGDAQVGVKQGKFRPYMCKDRGSDGPHLDRTRTAQYVRVAKTIVRELLVDNHPFIGHEFVLDLGTDRRTGCILPIEVNSFNHAGSYGVNLGLVWRPILELAKKHCKNQTLFVNDFSFWLGND